MPPNIVCHYVITDPLEPMDSLRGGGVITNFPCFTGDAVFTSSVDLTNCDHGVQIAVRATGCVPGKLIREQKYHVNHTRFCVDTVLLLPIC